MVNQETVPQASEPPLCVDLDGTLLKTDVLWESLLLLLKEHPWLALRLPLWLLKGKAHFKKQIAERVRLDVARLPYRAEVLEYLKRESLRRRHIVLVTASDETVSLRIAEHLGLFSEVFGSDGRSNLSGPRKAALLTSRFGHGRFDYLGNGEVDIPVWEAGRRVIAVAPSRRLLRRLRRKVEVHTVMAPRGGSLRSIARAMRPQQWVKNLLLFVPLVTSHRVQDLRLVGCAATAFAAFSLCASAVYILNDLLDIQNDRLHPRKRSRPFASGELSISQGVILAPLLLAAGAALAVLSLPWPFTLSLAAYLITTTAYSSFLKKLPVVDVLVLAGLYALRVLAGGLATDTVISEWLLPFAMFLFLSLALMKRFSEIMRMPSGGLELPGRGYRVEDAAWLQTAGLCAAYLAILVLALYIRSEDVAGLYRAPHLLWGFCLALWYWITRLWFRAHRGLIEDDPVVVTVSDPVSYAVAAVGALLLWAAI